MPTSFLGGAILKIHHHILTVSRSRLFDGPLPPELEGLPVIAVKERKAGLDREEVSHEH